MLADLPLLDQDLLERSRLQTELLKEQKRIIDELEQQQAQLRRLTATLQAELENYRSMKDEWDWFFEHAPDIMVIHDTDGRLRRVNPAVKDVLGYTRKNFFRSTGATFCIRMTCRGPSNRLHASRPA